MKYKIGYSPGDFLIKKDSFDIFLVLQKDTRRRSDGTAWLNKFYSIICITKKKHLIEESFWILESILIRDYLIVEPEDKQEQ